MRYIQSVSFPRTGHHILMRLLARYFSRDLDCYRSQLHGELLMAGEFRYCPFYTHCNQVPCPDPRVTIQKNHDFSLSLPVDPGQYYLIQYRNPFPCIASWYNFSLKTGILKDSKRSWEKFATTQLSFYRSFITRWIKENSGANCMVIKYENFLATPTDTLRGAVLFCNPDEPIDDAWIGCILSDADIKERSLLKDFKYYDPLFFDRLLKSAGLDEFVGMS